MKEYRTIREVNGPLMVVDQVEGVTYDELAEIQLSDGTLRRCKVLEVNGRPGRGGSCLKTPPASTCGTPRSVFWGIPCSWQCPRICWAVSLTAWPAHRRRPRSAAGEVSGHQRSAHESRRP